MLNSPRLLSNVTQPKVPNNLSPKEVGGSHRTQEAITIFEIDSSNVQTKK